MPRVDGSSGQTDAVSLDSSQVSRSFVLYTSSHGERVDTKWSLWESTWDRVSQKNKFTATLDFVSHRNKSLTGIHTSDRKGKGQSALHIRVPRGP